MTSTHVYLWGDDHFLVEVDVYDASLDTRSARTVAAAACRAVFPDHHVGCYGPADEADTPARHLLVVTAEARGRRAVFLDDEEHPRASID